MSPTMVLPALLLLAAAATNAQTTPAFNTTFVALPGLVANVSSSVAIFAFPPCSTSGQTVMLSVAPTVTSSGAATVTQTITVPQCRLKREAIIISDSSSGNTVVTNIGVRVTGLTNNTQYTAAYSGFSTTVTNVPLNFTTKNTTDYRNIPDVMARSGGMVVITVLLSVAMVILIIALIVTLVLYRNA